MSEAVLAVDLGGTKVEAALVDPEGLVLPATRRRAATGPTATAAELTDAIAGVIGGALTATPHGTALIGVGAAVPGPIDEPNGRTDPINLPVLHGFPLRDTIAEAAGVRPDSVQFRRDGVAVVLAAQWLGGARGARDALGIVISTGIGGGLIVGGRALGGNAGHIGQMQLSGLIGGDCLGSRTMLESVASGPNIVAWARERGFAGRTGPELAAARTAGDPVAAAAVQRCAEAVGQAIGSAVALVPVEVVAVGGGFARVAPDLVGRIGAVVASNPLPYVASTPVVDAGLDGDAPLVGAAALVYRSELLL